MRKLIVLILGLFVWMNTSFTQSNGEDEIIIKWEKEIGGGQEIEAIKEEGEDDIDFLNKNYDLNEVSIDDVIIIRTDPAKKEEEEPVTEADVFVEQVQEAPIASSSNRAVSSSGSRASSSKSTSSYRRTSKRKRSWNYGRIKKMKRKPRLGRKSRGCPRF